MNHEPDPKVIREAILEVVDNQLRDNTPPETRKTLNRLMKEGWSKSDARMLIAQCVSVEIFNVMKYNQPFDEARYKANLAKLPEEPFSDEG